MTLALRTRPLPRPLPGTAPAARTPDSEWVRYAAGGRYMYQLERANSLLARVIIDGDAITEWSVLPGRLCEAHHIAADLAALVGWLSRGGR